MLKFSIVFTLSKITAILIFLISAAYSFYTKTDAVLLIAIPTCAGMLGWKSYLEKTKKEVE